MGEGLDELDCALVVVERGSKGRGLSTKTGRSFLNVVSGTLGYAQDLGMLERNPVREFRNSLRRRARTQRARAEGEPGRHIRPIEGAGELSRLVASAREEGATSHALVLLLLDAGLRVGEAVGLRWGDVAWGRAGPYKKRFA